MNVHIFLYLTNIARDIRLLLKQRELKKKNGLVFNSEIVEKIELSLEMLYEIFYQKQTDMELFHKKKITIFFFELIRLGYRFKELKALSCLGYNFYVEKNVYLDQIIDMTDDDFTTKLEGVEYYIN